MAGNKPRQPPPGMTGFGLRQQLDHFSLNFFLFTYPDRMFGLIPDNLGSTDGRIRERSLRVD